MIVDVQTGSGLIKRCPECNRQVKKGACGEHGQVEGIYDLRIKADPIVIRSLECCDFEIYVINTE